MFARIRRSSETSAARAPSEAAVSRIGGFAGEASSVTKTTGAPRDCAAATKRASSARVTS